MYATDWPSSIPPPEGIVSACRHHHEGSAARFTAAMHLAHLLLVKHYVHGAKAVAIGPQRPSHQHLDAASSEIPLRGKVQQVEDVAAASVTVSQTQPLGSGAGAWACTSKRAPRDLCCKILQAWPEGFAWSHTCLEEQYARVLT